MIFFPWIRRTPGTGWIPNEPDARDWDIDQMGLPDASASSGSLEIFVPRVLNQRSTNSCVAHAIAGALGIVEKFNGLTADELSTLYLYYFARAERRKSRRVTDGGASIRTAFKVLRKIGMPPAHAWPFSTSKRIVNAQPRGMLPYTLAHPRTGGDFFAIKDYGQRRLDAIMACIDSGHPVVFGTPIGREMFGKEGPAIFSRPADSDIAGRHAMTIVGYSEGGNLFRVLNSWGPNWRDRGFCWFTWNYVTWVEATDFTACHRWRYVR